MIFGSVSKSILVTSKLLLSFMSSVNASKLRGRGCGIGRGQGDCCIIHQTLS